MPTLLPLRPNVCMLVINSKNLLFLGERAGCPEVWQLPQGGAEAGISLEKSVIRELHEELGAPKRSFEIIKKLRSTHSYEWKKPRTYSEGRFRGQQQTFWLVKFTGQDSEIDLQRYSPEFMRWQWCNVHQVRELAEPARLAGYMQPLREYEDYLLLKDESLS